MSNEDLNRRPLDRRCCNFNEPPEASAGCGWGRKADAEIEDGGGGTVPTLLVAAGR
jgi:hypothetical protein